MTFAATWMDLEMTILGEVSQTEKDKYHMISLICRILKKKVQGGRFKREGTYIYIYGWFMLVYARNQQYCKAITLQLKIN